MGTSSYLILVDLSKSRKLKQ